MNFSEWLLTEGLQLDAAPGLQDHLSAAKDALLKYLNRYGGLELTASSARYKFTLTKYNDDWSYSRYQFRYQPIEKNRGSQEEIAPKGDDRYKYYSSDWDGRTGRRLYPSPQDAIGEIPADPNMGYRGMSWEEWRQIEKSGVVQSAGQYNFSNQQGLTLFGYTPDTGTHYASGFAPAAFKPAPTRPGIVVAVPRSFLKTDKEHSGIPQGELGHIGPLSNQEIKAVWMVNCISARPGTVELLVLRDGRVQEGSRSDVSMQYAIRQIR